VKNGGFGAVLVQAPIGTPAPSFTDPIIVTAQQGSQTAPPAQIDLVPPPVILIHGNWDDRHGLGGDDGAGSTNGLAHYLKITSPWRDYSDRYKFDFVQVICHSVYIGFDAITDPVLDSSYSDPALQTNSCEQTSRDAITARIYGLLSELDIQQIVGSRVDVVAHSLGGLAVRNYSSQIWYRNDRNRQQGQFHEIITLDTPELGTQLAYFLDTHSNCPVPLGWSFFGLACSLTFSQTLDQCLATLSKPLAAPNEPLTTGAIYALFPNGRPLKKLSAPTILGADWRAIGSVAPTNSTLKAFLNGVIAAIYPSTCAPGSAPTVDQILLENPNDAVVTLPSQLDGIESDHAQTFHGLSHSGFPVDLGTFGLSSANVVNCNDVNQLVWCWLSHAGDSVCLKCVIDPPACSTEAASSKITTSNKSITSFSHIATTHPHTVNRLTLGKPTGSLELGRPFELVVNTGTGGRPELHVVQSSQTGTQKEVPVSISQVERQTVHLNVTPQLHGNSRFQMTAAYPDGGVATKAVTATVDYPEGPPVEFHADELAFAGIPLPLPKKPDDSGNPTLRLQPWAKWDSTGPRVYLNTSDVSYAIDPPSGSSVINLSPTNGIIRGLTVGTATVKAQFRSVPSQVQVNVVDKQQ
jgi:pimeloyl-ACP methyl ester carboxylesterase